MSLKSCREKANITIKRIVEILGIDRKTYYNWETKQKDIPSSMLIRLADILSCSLNDLLDYKKTKEYTLTQEEIDEIHYLLKMIGNKIDKKR